MPVPEYGRHAGHLVTRGRCTACGRWLDHADHIAPPCPVCPAETGDLALGAGELSGHLLGGHGEVGQICGVHLIAAGDVE